MDRWERCFSTDGPVEGERRPGHVDMSGNIDIVKNHEPLFDTDSTTKKL